MKIVIHAIAVVGFVETKFLTNTIEYDYRLNSVAIIVRFVGFIIAARHQRTWNS